MERPISIGTWLVTPHMLKGTPVCRLNGLPARATALPARGYPGMARSKSTHTDDSKAPLAPMEAVLVEELPSPPGWQYEPKWDGFRAIAAREGDNIEIWSKSGKPLGRYFPEMIAHIRNLPEKHLLLDGELVIPIGDHLSFNVLQARLHPAASRIAKLSRETPAQLILFDALAIGSSNLRDKPLAERRGALEALYSSIVNSSLILSPASTSLEQAKTWLAETGGALDGVIAKALDEPYRPGERAMRKVKQLRTADCVVGGYRKTAKGDVASLLLGLYTQTGHLDLVGFSSGFPATERKALIKALKPHEGGPGFTGKAPGGPSRWNPDKSGDYIALDHGLVAEVIYDQITAGRFRHGTRFRRWRPDKAPVQCTFDQLVRELKPAELIQLVEKSKEMRKKLPPEDLT
ncbi:ATP-dependent DNA ligase [Sphingobium sp. B1D7B]|uniref:ATP-dependent DNA ligase n=1 Tax=Sphingobium sp. B1D7B TaxID=2940578 RepID=UPI0022256EE6|nr:ATP-dependent DNA ligase [Sphingobium sp. B1D7B]MCW2406695.1 ATP-dependent DNA ligase [Sphingobium sp. B1D7B]